MALIKDEKIIIQVKKSQNLFILNLIIVEKVMKISHITNALLADNIFSPIY